MTADVNTLQHTGYKPVSTAGVNAPSHATSAFSGSFLFDDDDHQSKTTSGEILQLFDFYCSLIVNMKYANCFQRHGTTIF
jgi:hypothetical protein